MLIYNFLVCDVDVVICTFLKIPRIFKSAGNFLFILKCSKSEIKMDIYGYPGYPYNQPDELSKQMFAQQALASNTPFSREVPEAHTMPVPSGAPWNSRGLSWGMQSPPQLVQFTALTPYKDANKISPVIHCKRKSLDIEPVIPAKQLITEERMAAHLNGLHISSDYTSHTSAEQMDVWMDTQTPTNSFEATPVIEKLKGHTIVLSDELKRLQEEPLIPAALIERLEKPTMSLVVWKPRENILEKIKEEERPKEEKEELPKRRNGVLVHDDIGMNDVDM